MNKKLALASVLFTVGVFSGTAQAVPVMCGDDGTAVYTDETPDITISTTDVTLGGSNSTDCFYDIRSGNSDLGTEAGIVNETTWAQTPLYSDVLPGTGTDLFGGAAKDNIEIGEDDVSNTVLGLMWSLAFTSTTPSSGTSTPESGTWVLSWTDPSTTETFPLYFDIVVLFKASQDMRTGYLFDDFKIESAPANASGSYEINITNGNNFAALSHGSLFIRAGTAPGPDPDPNPAPVPGTLLLLGLGLFGLRFARKSAV